MNKSFSALTVFYTFFLGLQLKKNTHGLKDFKMYHEKNGHCIIKVPKKTSIPNVQNENTKQTNKHTMLWKCIGIISGKVMLKMWLKYGQ